MLDGAGRPPTACVWRRGRQLGMWDPPASCAVPPIGCGGPPSPSIVVALVYGGLGPALPAEDPRQAHRVEASPETVREWLLRTRNSTTAQTP